MCSANIYQQATCELLLLWSSAFAIYTLPDKLKKSHAAVLSFDSGTFTALLEKVALTQGWLRTSAPHDRAHDADE